MSRMIIAGVGLAVVIAGAGFYAVKQGAVSAPEGHAEASAPQFTSNADKVLYGMAARQSQQIKNSLKALTELGITVDEAMLVKGFQDGLKGNVALTEEEQIAAAEAFRSEFEALSQKKNEELASTAKAQSDTFLAEFDKQEGVVKTTSGLRYKVVTPGDGKASPKATDQVVVHYTGTLVDGTKFDSSVDRGQPATFGVSGVIKGWTEALMLMSKGAKYQLAIPSDLAYGSGGTGPIPPGATLLFDVELIDIISADQPAK